MYLTKKEIICESNDPFTLIYKNHLENMGFNTINYFFPSNLKFLRLPIFFQPKF